MFPESFSKILRGGHGSLLSQRNNVFEDYRKLFGVSISIWNPVCFRIRFGTPPSRPGCKAAGKGISATLSATLKGGCAQSRLNSCPFTRQHFHKVAFFLMSRSIRARFRTKKPPQTFSSSCSPPHHCDDGHNSRANENGPQNADCGWQIAGRLGNRLTTGDGQLLIQYPIDTEQ